MHTDPISIGQFSLNDAISCGAEIRHLGKQAADEASFGKALLNCLRQHFVDDDGAPAIALARLFKTDSYGRLDPEL